MKFRHTVQLGAALALLVLVYFGSQVMTQKSQEHAIEARKIFSFETDSIQKLTIAPLAGPSTTGEQHTDGSWAITAPDPAIKANQLLWKRVAENLVALKNERSLPESDAEEEAYGLAVPRLTVSVDTGGAVHTLHFGYLDPTQTTRYATLDGGEVFLVDKDAVFELDRPLDLLRDSFLVDNVESPIIHLEFARYLTEEAAKKLENPPPLGEESSVVIFERPNPESEWVQITPSRVAANGDLVNALADELRSARGRSHVDSPESMSDYGLDPGVARLTVMDADEGQPQTFYFGDVTTEGEKGGIYVHKDGEKGVFIMDAHILTLFPRTVNSFRERRLVTRLKSPTKIERIAAEKNYTLELGEDSQWRMTTPPLDDTDPFYASQFINALKMLEGVRFYTEAPETYGLDTPEAIFQFTLEGQETPIEIRLTPSADVEGHYYVLTDAGEVTSLPAEHIKFLLSDAHAFRDRSLLRFDRRRAARLDFSFDGVDYVLEKQHDRWLVTSPANHYMPNQRDAEDLVAAVVALRAVGTETATSDAAAEYGFESPRFTLTVTLAPESADGESEVVGPLTVGGIVPGLDQQRFAQSIHREGIFMIPQTFVEAVQAAVGGIRPQPAGAAQGN